MMATCGYFRARALVSALLIVTVALSLWAVSSATGEDAAPNAAADAPLAQEEIAVDQAQPAARTRRGRPSTCAAGEQWRSGFGARLQQLAANRVARREARRQRTVGGHTEVPFAADAVSQPAFAGAAAVSNTTAEPNLAVRHLDAATRNSRLAALDASRSDRRNSARERAALRRAELR